MALLDAYLAFSLQMAQSLKKHAECHSTYHINYEKWIYQQKFFDTVAPGEGK